MSKQAQSKKNSLRSAQNTILTSTSPLYHFNAARENLNHEEYLALVTWALTVRKRGKLIFQKLTQSLYPRKLEYLKLLPIQSKITPTNELHWSCAIIIANNNNILKFIKQSEEFERELLAGDIAKCSSILDDIESNFGHSQWIIETRTAFLQFFEGIESQKNYLANIKENSVSNIPWLASTYSQRNEETTTFFRFVTQTRELLSELDSCAQRDSLTYRALDMLPGGADRLSDVLRYESNAPIIDQYTTLISVLQECITSEDDELKNTATICLTKLNVKIIDPRISRMLFIAGKLNSPHQEEFNSPELIDDTIKITNEKTREFEAQPSDWPLAWKTTATKLLNSNLRPELTSGIQGSVTSDLYQIFLEGSDADAIISQNLKKCLNFRNFSFSKILEEILWRELSSDPAPSKRAELIRFINTRHLDPNLISCLPNHIRKKYSEELILKYNKNPKVLSCIWQSNTDNSTPLNNITTESELQIRAEKAIHDEKFNYAIELASNLINDPCARTRKIASRIKAKALSLKNEAAPLIEFVSTQSIIESGIINMLPVPHCAKLLDKTTRKQLAGNITTPIVLSIFSRHYDDRFDKPLSYAYEDFLLRNGITRPSEIVTISPQPDLAYIIYYLRHICIPEIMKVSTAFTGSADLQDERLAVCSILLTLDEKNAKEYESEIREITRSQIIRKGVRHVEQSKMSIDAPAIRKWADKKLKENFLRYQALVKAGFNPAAGFKEALYESLSAGKPMPKEFFEVPTDEAGALIKYIVYAIIQESTISPMHGLDCYLSMRIRHGALSGQLRGPLEEERIITQRKGDENSYTPNDYWISNLSHLAPRARDEIDICLCVLSAQYDNLIETMTNQLIQIRTKEKPDALFNVSFSYADLRLIASSINDETTFDEFFDLCIDLFWRCVDSCLANVHTTIDKTLKPALNDIFHTLQANISSASTTYSTAELDRAIRTAQTNAQQALEQVKDWFKLPTPRSEPAFNIEELIDIGLQCVQRIHRDFSPTIIKTIPPLPPLADALTIFSDIFFHNI